MGQSMREHTEISRLIEYEGTYRNKQHFSSIGAEFTMIIGYYVHNMKVLSRIYYPRIFNFKKVNNASMIFHKFFSSVSFKTPQLFRASHRVLQDEQNDN